MVVVVVEGDVVYVLWVRVLLPSVLFSFSSSLLPFSLFLCSTLCT